MSRQTKQVVYSADGSGKWTRTEWSGQCGYRFFDKYCQGADGHEGDHWVYRPDGAYIVSMPDGGFQIIAVKSRRWVHPLNVPHPCFMFQSATTEVTDQNYIKRLEVQDADEPDAEFDIPYSEDADDLS